MDKPIAAAAMPAADALPLGSTGRRASGWWGLMAMIVTEAALFGYLLFAYFYLAAQSPSAWPPDGAPDLRMPTINTLILLSSSVMVWLAERSARRASRGWSLGFLAVTLALGSLFALIQIGEWQKQPYGLTSHVYGSLYFTITGFHLAHVVAGLAMIGVLLVWSALGFVSRERHLALSIGGMYWHFVDAVWLVVFTALYLTPYLFGTGR